MAVRNRTDEAANTPLLTNATVGTSAAKLVTTPLAWRKRLIVANNGTAVVYLGFAATLTVAAGGNHGGLPIAVGDQVTLDLDQSVDVYAISGTAAQDVRVVEFA